MISPLELIINWNNAQNPGRHLTYSNSLAVEEAPSEQQMRETHGEGMGCPCLWCTGLPTPLCTHQPWSSANSMIRGFHGTMDMDSMEPGTKVLCIRYTTPLIGQI